jgi:hypothetical protein
MEESQRSVTLYYADQN